jgi:fructosamine-3-kinase
MTLAEQGVALLGGSLIDALPLTGGDVSQIVRIKLDDGREAVVKGGSYARAEADMLRAIAASGAPTPRVLAASESALVLEAMPSDGSLNNAWGSLGRVLRTLHARKGKRYGWPSDYAFGAVSILNDWLDDWPSFWAERRLLVHEPHIPSELGRRLEKLACEIPNRLPSRPVPALLHGDLWGGNVLVSGTEVSALIDPACYYGHSEVDIAMLTLFDRPKREFFAAYGEMDAGWEERLTIYKLWPALVHLRLFGPGYRPLAESLLDAAGV